jgi:protein involved in polysaccharide export with SLBB domain
MQITALFVHVCTAGVAISSMLMTSEILRVQTAAAEDTSSAQTAALQHGTKVDAETVATPLMRAPAYRLGVGDRVKLKVYERDDISGEFRVRPDGTIAVPLLGSFPAVDQSPEALEESIARGLASLTSHRPHLSIEVIEWRPVYVAGIVDKPGIYAFSPGMTASHAVAAAGGIYRPIAGARMTIDVTRELGQQQQTKEELKRAWARRARLAAEIRGARALTAPDRLVELAGAGEASAIMQAERQIFDRRSFNYQRRIEAAQQEIVHANSEAQASRKQLELLQRRIALAKAELESTEKLVDRGLTTRPRVVAMKQEVAALETQWHEIEAAIARAQRTVAGLEDRKAALDTERGLELDEQAKSTEEEIRRLELQLRASRNVVREMAPELANALAGPDAVLSSPSISYQIMRLVDGRQVVFPAEETTPLLPGDVLRTQLPPAATLAASPLRAGTVSDSLCNSTKPDLTGLALQVPC